ncbi:V-type ATP synthase subunit D [bacterium]|nr:V-type ATP synthase subunit D [bacterium]NCQ55603.1 V-type ATP synthase subunit D [Candidatus Parcubacteria bacterium]NCS67428.1 V-type ATP synthase subunit D [Candidatus Peregrinibacteria bacterium]NCS96154.1 V-type ATP synthase subunit D [bacterium]
MAIKNVTATRMTMLGLKNQTKVAKRGHKLLKDKQDGLMQEFLTIVHKAKKLRTDVEAAIKGANESFLLAQAAMPKEILENVLSTPTQKLSLQVKTKNVMSVRIPVFKLKTEGNALHYGLTQTRGELDLAISEFSKVFLLLLELAEIEKSAENLALEIEKTRRRVNALEYRLIPDLEDTLKFIKMKLGEAERSAIVQVMAIKNMIEEQEAKAAKVKA